MGTLIIWAFHPPIIVSFSQSIASTRAYIQLALYGFVEQLLSAFVMYGGKGHFTSLKAIEQSAPQAIHSLYCDM